MFSAVFIEYKAWNFIKRDSYTVVFLWILQKILEYLFNGVLPEDYFCINDFTYLIVNQWTYYYKFNKYQRNYWSN